ncbi:hypothetical protein ROZALSC1DRAFT_31820 [Rozella allomycis CSF55]|uniref:PH domain-containing protein n=1 Tax=Rozella allomycis (strain CSF55) TaxID=988480 RepID=A0A4P9YAN6_ROZAC|nr:hypothetical protein ROZALSC1DRAFT_31820 [Rozella allomycis CSF55]
MTKAPYYKEYKCSRIIDVKNILSVSDVEYNSKHTLVVTKEKTYFFDCFTEDEYNEWFDAFQKILRPENINKLNYTLTKVEAPRMLNANEFPSPLPTAAASEFSRTLSEDNENLEKITHPDGEIIKKQGYSFQYSKFKTWKKKWIVLRPGKLYIYKDERLSFLLVLRDLVDVVQVDKGKNDKCIKLIRPKHSIFLCWKNDEAEFNEWLTVLKEEHRISKKDCEGFVLPFNK